MMTAEQWYEYQDTYKRYGLEMQPKQLNRIASREAAKPVFTTGEIGRVLTAMILIGALVIGVIVASAYCASVKYENNALIKENAQLENDIRDLNVKLNMAANINTVEQRALDELGMVYPSPSQFVFLTDEETPGGDFAFAIKEIAYRSV